MSPSEEEDLSDFYLLIVAVAPELKSIERYWQYIQKNVRLEDGQADTLDSLQSFLEIKFSVLATAGPDGELPSPDHEKERGDKGDGGHKSQERAEGGGGGQEGKGEEGKAKNETEPGTETEESDTVVADTETEEDEAEIRMKRGGERVVIGGPSTFEEAKEMFPLLFSQSSSSSSSSGSEEELTEFYPDGVFWGYGTSCPAKTFVSLKSVYVLTSRLQSVHVFPFEKTVGIGRSDALVGPGKQLSHPGTGDPHFVYPNTAFWTDRLL